MRGSEAWFILSKFMALSHRGTGGGLGVVGVSTGFTVVSAGLFTWLVISTTVSLLAISRISTVPAGE